MAVFAGGKVLLGIDPGYSIIKWVPVYNYTLWILTIFITAILIWTNSRFAPHASVGTFSLPAIAMLVLQTLYRHTFAPENIQAMTLRLIVWAIILGLVYAGSRRSVQQHNERQASCTGLEPAALTSESRVQKRESGIELIGVENVIIILDGCGSIKQRCKNRFG